LAAISLFSALTLRSFSSNALHLVEAGIGLSEAFLDEDLCFGLLLDLLLDNLVIGLLLGILNLNSIQDYAILIFMFTLAS
jgi:hypothetical protein